MKKILLAFGSCIPLLVGCAIPPEARTRQVYSFLEARHQNVVIQQWDISCGAAALATILTYQHDDPITEKEAAAGMLQRTTPEIVRQRLGFSLLDLKRFAQTRGYEADGYGELTLADLEKFGPTIVPILVRGLAHFVVFRGVQGDRVLLADPAFGNRTMKIDQFEEMWGTRIGFTVQRNDGLPSPNYLAARPSDFWASSVTPGSIVMAEHVSTPPDDAPQHVAQAPTADVHAVTPVEGAAVAEHQIADDADITEQPTANATVPVEKPQVAVAELTRPAAAADKTPATVEPPGPAPATMTKVPRPRPTAAPKATPDALQITAGHGDGRQPPLPSSIPSVPTDRGRLQSSVSALPSPPNTETIEQAMMRRGRELLKLGDVISARLYFERAAASGSEEAANMAGRTYDPAYLRESGAQGIQPDLERANEWYRKARERRREPIRPPDRQPGHQVAAVTD
jgi:uncharacterized protein